MLTTSVFDTSRLNITRKKPAGETIDLPLSVVEYNRYKGGVDSATRMMHELEFFRRDAKWPLRIFHGLSALTSINSHLAYNRQVNGDGLSLVDSIFELGCQLCKL